MSDVAVAGWGAFGALWMLIGPGWPVSWLTPVPLLLVAVFVFGRRRGERATWARELRCRERQAAQAARVGRLLHDPQFVRTMTAREQALRDLARWN